MPRNRRINAVQQCHGSGHSVLDQPDVVTLVKFVRMGIPRYKRTFPDAWSGAFGCVLVLSSLC
jgi:hypothetical protein